MIPPEYLVPFLISNALALFLLGVAFKRPQVIRWLSVLIFAAAALLNARLALTRAAEYLGYGPLAWSSAYREFIYGWLSQHVQTLVLPIAVGQLLIAVLLTRRRPWRRIGVVGAIVFLCAIAPLGVGSAFPFSFWLSAALLVMEWQLSRKETPLEPIVRTYHPPSRLIGHSAERQS